MGLDMYLSAKRSVNWRSEDEAKAVAIQKMFPELEGRSGRWGGPSVVQEVTIEAGYWRKANAIHDWFVKNVQDGVDECQDSYVGRESLIELKGLCEEVLADPKKAAELLPTASGFFFGSTDYDQYYMDDLQLTVDIINRCLVLPNDWEFEYRSSW
jgi:hypothetical protein